MQTWYCHTQLCGADGVAGDIARYTGRDPSHGEEAKRLAMVMSLDPRYFPEELYTSKERKYAALFACAPT